MANSAIEWTNKVWNPITGCSKVSEGCRNCYALREWARLSANPKQPDYFGRAFTDVATHEHRLRQPLDWPAGTLAFVNSMSDLFHEKVAPQFIAKTFAMKRWPTRSRFRRSPNARPRCCACFRSRRFASWSLTSSTYSPLSISAAWGTWSDAIRLALPENWPLPNLWLGVSVEDQPTADERIPLLQQTPAAVRWISAEPLLGPIDLTKAPAGSKHTVDDALRGIYGSGYPNNYARRPLDWVVVGGESGPAARPMHPDWARSLRDQCAKAGVPFFFKQWGEWMPADEKSNGDWPKVTSDKTPLKPTHHWSADSVPSMRVGKKAAGDLLDGVQHHAYPTAKELAHAGA